MMPTIRFSRSLAALPILLSLVGCGTIAGLGAKPAPPMPAGVSALKGWLIGQQAAGRSLPQDARARALNAEYEALQFTPAGVPVTWSADDYSGQVVPTQVYRVGDQACRAYSQTFKGSGPAVKISGTACRNEDGTWTPV